MQPDTHRPRRRTFVLAFAAALVLLLLIGVGVYGLVRGPAPHPASGLPASPDPGRHDAVPSPTPGPLLLTNNPEQFARTTSEALFTWDTADGVSLAESMQPLIDRADPEDAPALASDVRGYFPDPVSWAKLRPLQVRQWIDIDSVRIPEAWATAQAQARPGDLPPGATAYTITGTRHRTGIWDTTPVADARPVSFTIFLACAREAPCRLLRLSAVDTPLR